MIPFGVYLCPFCAGLVGGSSGGGGYLVDLEIGLLLIMMGFYFWLFLFINHS